MPLCALEAVLFSSGAGFSSFWMETCAIGGSTLMQLWLRAVSPLAQSRRTQAFPATTSSSLQVNSVQEWFSGLYPGKQLSIWQVMFWHFCHGLHAVSLQQSWLEQPWLLVYWHSPHSISAQVLFTQACVGTHCSCLVHW